MMIAPGATLGSYQIVEAIGSGAMGEVFRAKDTKLKRDVAIKVLPSTLAADSERIARFAREAETLASLSHANIATIHGVEGTGGMLALVMELVEGPTLGERLCQGPIPVDEAVAIAHQVAEALEAAHARGVVHRDLKPDNIKLRPDGTVKVLDFGIAKVMEPAVPGTEHSAPGVGPTTMTKAGAVIGTAAYMSPEQARGLPVDAQSDIWAFGAVLFEMLAGHRAFEGHDATDTMASILKSEPDWDALPGALPPAIRVFLERCLTKNPQARLHHIADMRLALEGAFSDAYASDATRTAERIASRRIVLAASTIAAIAITVLAANLAGLFGRPDPVNASPQGARFVVRPPADLPLVTTGLGGNRIAITPDGSKLLYISSGQGGSIAVRSIADSIAVTRLWAVNSFTGAPIVSPDSEWVAFVAEEGFERIRVSGGSSIEITGSRGRIVRGASWNENGTITFADSRGLFVVSADSGTPQIIATPDREAGEFAFASPHGLPGDQAFLYTVIYDDGRDPAIALFDMTTRQHRILFSDGISPHYTQTGHIVYVADGLIQARRFDAETFAVDSNPVTVSDEPVDVVADGGEAQMDLSDTGTLVYVAPRTSEGPGSQRLRYAWVDREGNAVPASFPPGAYTYAHVSPNGEFIVADIVGTSRDIYKIDLARNNLVPIDLDPSEDAWPIWNHDGSEVLFASDRNSNSENPMRAFAKSADGTGEARQLLETEQPQWPLDVSRDGTAVIVLYGDAPDGDVGRIVLGEPPRIEILVDDEGLQYKASLSPNQEWLLYQTDETGRFEVYVTRYPDAGQQKQKVSIDGGEDAHWSIDGSEIFYRDFDGTMLAVPVTYAEEGISLDDPARLFDAPEGDLYNGNAVRGPSYDVSPKDGRFLIRQAEGPGAEQRIVVWQNWMDRLERLDPSD